MHYDNGSYVELGDDEGKRRLRLKTPQKQKYNAVVTAAVADDDDDYDELSSAPSLTMYVYICVCLPFPRFAHCSHSFVSKWLVVVVVVNIVVVWKMNICKLSIYIQKLLAI